MSMYGKVKITVHRGTHQIGGCCTEIEYLSTRILIDIGQPLPGYEQNKLQIEGVTKGNAKCDGIFLTHYHGDHIGELSNVVLQIPIYASSCTKEFIKAYKERIGRNYVCDIDSSRIITVSHGESVIIGDLKVRAIKADHSAAGAFMYLIEAGDKRILHTGDFRLHGRNSNRLISDICNLGKIDLLITEGTSIIRNNSTVWDEESVTARVYDCVKQYKYCFVIASSSNIDRVQSISEAVPRGKYFLMDEFQKKLLDMAVDYEGYVFEKPLVYGKNLEKKMETCGFVMLIRESNSNIYEEYVRKYPDDTCLIYSMWSGYLEYPRMKKLFGIAEKNKRIIHSSGHVVLDDLNEFINIIGPKKIVVIHTDTDDVDGLEQKKNIMSIKDGERFYL